MCLIVFSVATHPSYPLVVVANRDEFHRRPTARATFWDDAPQVLAGRDLEAGGTWMGITKGGRFAAITNYREPESHRPDAPSRGRLVADFLTGTSTSEAFVDDLTSHGDVYNGFNIVVGADGDHWYFGNRGGAPRRLNRGVYGLSNHILDTPWPKVKRCTTNLRRLLRVPTDLRAEDLTSIVDDRDQAPDYELPNTGVPLEWERLLSAPCIVSPNYGTRSTTVVLIDSNEHVDFIEHTRDPAGDIVASSAFDFDIS